MKLPMMLVVALGAVAAGCRSGKPAAGEIIVYCGVDEPYASQIFADFERETGLHIAPLYDIESSKSVGLAGRLEAERDHPRADVFWGSEAFLSVRLAREGVLQADRPNNAGDIPARFKDSGGYWTGVGLRARVLAVAEGAAAPTFRIRSLEDLADPRLKDKCAMSRPTAGATGAHVAALYAMWGVPRAQAFFRKLHANGVSLLGGNAEVADQVGAGIYAIGLTDSDDVTNTSINGGKISMVAPDQEGEGTLAMPTTVCLIRGAPHAAAARRLIDYLVSRSTEQKLISLKFARWSVRGGGNDIKVMNVDYNAAADVYARAQREATALLEGR